jgi:hypothetical protein
LGVTAHPSAEWIARQLTEACGWNEPPRYIIRDRDGAYGEAFTRRLTAMGIRDRPISARSPWQNGLAERLIGSKPKTVSGFTISNGLRQSLNHRLARIQKRRSAFLRQGRGCRRCSTTNCWRRQRFSAISSDFGLKVAAMAKISNRNTCAPAAVIPARAPHPRLVNAKPSGSVFAPNRPSRSSNAARGIGGRHGF